MQRKLISLMFATILLVSAAFGTAFSNAGANPGPEDGGAVVAIAWRKDLKEGFKQDMLLTLDHLGVEYHILDQVMYNGVTYDGSCVSDACAEQNGMLTEQCAQKVRENWMNSNVEEVAAARDFDLVIFTGGEDVSPSLQKKPGVEKNAGEAYNAARDISDYILMSYCLERDIPIFAICRGIQMLAVVSGGVLLQDIPAYYAEMGKEDMEYHRMPAGRENRDYVAHDVNILERDSLLYAIAQTDVIKNAPSWHHQSVLSAEGTPLMVTASATRGGVEIIEAIERTDRAFALGIQYHPEASVIKHINGAANAKDFTDKDECIAFFERLIDYAVSLRKAEKAA